MSNSGPAVRVYSEGRAARRPEDCYRRMERDIDVLNQQMDAAGARIFAGGLSAAGQPDGKVRITDGPYLETRST